MRLVAMREFNVPYETVDDLPLSVIRSMSILLSEEAEAATGPSKPRSQKHQVVANANMSPEEFKARALALIPKEK